jgi:hypothetical protein
MFQAECAEEWKYPPESDSVPGGVDLAFSSNSDTLNGNIVNLKYQSKVWTHLLIQGIFFIFTIFYIVE